MSEKLTEEERKKFEKWIVLLVPDMFVYRAVRGKVLSYYERLFGGANKYELLHKSREAINRDGNKCGKYEITIDGLNVCIWDALDCENIYYPYSEHNDSEIEALEQALIYIWKESI